MTSPAVAPRRPSTRRAVIAWGVAAFDLGIFLLSLVIWSSTDLPLPVLDIATFCTIPIAFGCVGAILTTRVPGNIIGPLLLAATTGLAALVGSQAYALAATELGLGLPGVRWAGLVSALVFIPSLLLILIGIPLLFPDGRLLSPRWKWVIVLTVLAVIPVEIQSAVATADLNEVAGLASPLANAEVEAFIAPFAELAAIAAVGVLVAAYASLVVRYRRSDDVGRAQIRWLAAVVTVAVVAFSISFNAQAELRTLAESIGLVALNAIPLAIGIAIVRYRLYEIDRLISRGISYAIVSVLLLAAYATSVIVLQGPLGGLVGEDTITVAVSTLIVASLFQPIRRRVQRIVDRRFDRARVDGERTIDAFGERLRDEVDIDTLVRDLGLTIDQAVRPARQGLWLRDDGR